MKKFKDYLEEGAGTTLPKMVKELKGNEFDYNNDGDGIAFVKMSKGQMKVAQGFFYGELPALNKLETTWNPGGMMHEHFKSKYGVETKVVDSDSWAFAKQSPYKKFFDDGVVEVTVEI